jgi:hypothetical protein
MTGPLDAASRVAFHDVRDYLKSRGWKSASSRRSYAAIFRSPSDAVEVVVPLDRALADYADAMASVAARVGEVEGRDAIHVLRDLLQPQSDVLRFALEGEAQKAGTIGLLDGQALVSGVTGALLASACGVQRPRKYHPRMSLVEAEAYVQGCMLGQTEVGSFVVTVNAPLDIGEQPTSKGPFGRLASEYLLGAAALLADSVRKDDLAPILDVPDEEARISSNLCQSILKMLPRNESADLRLRSSWSALLPASRAPSFVGIDRDMYEAVEDVALKLRPSAGPTTDQFIGMVAELAGEPGPDGPVEGEVTLWTWVGDEVLRARAVLGATDYAIAVQAHIGIKYLQFRASLHPGRRVNQLKDVTEFRILPD